MLFELVEQKALRARLVVIGVGGGGGNAVNTMVAAGMEGVEFIAANTDSQVLETSLAPLKVQLGAELTKGLGCGGDPDLGRRAALEDADRMAELVGGADMVFVTAGMGGGTGTGAAPVIARAAKEGGALTVGVVTKPFLSEGTPRMAKAEAGIKELRGSVDTLITIPNQRLLALVEKKTSVLKAFEKANDVLLQAVRGIADLITVPGLINLDFADVRAIMRDTGGLALMGSARASGENRAVVAAQNAISSPLLEEGSIQGARGVLINVTGGLDLSLYEVNEASSLVHDAAHEEANIILGTVVDERMGDEVRVTVIATGFGKEGLQAVPEPARAAGEARGERAELPAFKRRKARTEGALAYQVEEEAWDIPTFLRKQAD